MNDLATFPAPAVDRRKFIGGSDVAAIMGLSPWQTPLQLYEQKIATTPPEPLPAARLKFFARRKRQEPVVAEMLADEYGIEVTRLSLDANPNRYIDPEYPFFAAEIDFEFLMTPTVREHFPEREDFAAIPDGETINGEIKTVHPFAAAAWGEQGSENVPVHYACQLMWGLGVKRRPGALCAALFGLDNLLAFPIMPDADTIDGMRAKALHFWTHHVLAHVPPDPINMEDMMRLFAKVNGRPVEADEPMLDALMNLRRIRASMTTMEREKDELTFQIADAIRQQWGIPCDAPAEAGDNAIITAGGAPFATWKKQSRASIDVGRLRAEQAAIAAQYSRTTWFRSIRFSKPKGA